MRSQAANKALRHELILERLEDLACELLKVMDENTVVNEDLSDEEFYSVQMSGITAFLCSFLEKRFAKRDRAGVAEDIGKILAEEMGRINEREKVH